MSIKQIIGAVLISIPFIAVFAFLAQSGGLATALFVFGGALATTGVIFVGILLLLGEL